MSQSKTKSKARAKAPAPQAVGTKAKAVLRRQAKALRELGQDNEAAFMTLLALMEDAEKALGDLKAQARGQKAQATIARLDEQLTRMIEGCSTQDLTGQRLERVARVLEGTADGRASASEADPFGDRLLEGPQTKGGGMDQSAIDALFD